MTSLPVVVEMLLRSLLEAPHQRSPLLEAPQRRSPHRLRSPHCLLQVLHQRSPYLLTPMQLQQLTQMQFQLLTQGQHQLVRKALPLQKTCAMAHISLQLTSFPYQQYQRTAQTSSSTWLTMQQTTGGWSTTDKKNKSFGVIGEFGTLNLGLVEYSFGAIHFHFPSEHTIDNKTFAGEMQLMHSGPNGSKAIVSILFEEDEVEENDFLTTISEFATLSKPVVGNGTLSVLPGFEEQLAGSYYSYAGSITSPPCTEGVEWYIMQETARVSAEQILTFVEAFGGQTANRELQPLNDRTVCFNTFANECLNMSVIGEEPEGGEEVPVEVPEREPIKVCAAVKKPSCEECNKYTATDKTVKEGPDCGYVESEGKCASEVLVKEKRWIVTEECKAAGLPAPPAAGVAGAVPGAGAAPADGAQGAAAAPEGGAAPAPEGGDAPAPEGGDAPAPEGGDAPAPEAAAPAPEGGDAPAPEGEAAPAPERKKSNKKMA